MLLISQQDLHSGEMPALGDTSPDEGPRTPSVYPSALINSAPVPRQSNQDHFASLLRQRCVAGGQLPWGCQAMVTLGLAAAGRSTVVSRRENYVPCGTSAPDDRRSLDTNRRDATARFRRLTPGGLGDVRCLVVKEHWYAGFQRPKAYCAFWTAESIDMTRCAFY